jgi:hypothetical protein
MVIGLLSSCVLLAVLAPANCLAASSGSWNGTWSGVLNSQQPVSVTIASGKVVGYTIMGSEPFPIAYSTVTLSTVSFGDKENFTVLIRRIGGNRAFGTAHGAMGEGAASLTRH